MARVSSSSPLLPVFVQFKSFLLHGQAKRDRVTKMERQWEPELCVTVESDAGCEASFERFSISLCRPPRAF